MFQNFSTKEELLFSLNSKSKIVYLLETKQNLKKYFEIW